MCSSSALTTCPAHCHTPLPIPTTQGLAVSPFPTCPAPLTASPCERTPAPCPQCSVQKRRWSPSEPPPLAPQSHSGLVRQSPWQRRHWREERWDRKKRGSDGRLDYLTTECVPCECVPSYYNGARPTFCSH